MQINIIAAVAQNKAIGHDNKLLYWLPNDLKRFKTLTSGHTIVMGRKTFESIGRPLPKRTNIVISRGFDAPEGIMTVSSLEEAYNAASAVISGETGTSSARCFVIGGGQIYAQALSSADRLIVTHVHTVIEDADTYFPVLDPSVWAADVRSELFHDEETGYDFEFVEYVRKS